MYFPVRGRPWTCTYTNTTSVSTRLPPWSPRPLKTQAARSSGLKEKKTVLEVTSPNSGSPPQERATRVSHQVEGETEEGKKKKEKVASHRRWITEENKLEI